jgi:hypothetical protein
MFVYIKFHVDNSPNIRPEVGKILVVVKIGPVVRGTIIV